MTEIPFGISRQRDNNAYDARKALIYKYEVSYEMQETLNEGTSRWNNFKIKDTSLETDIWLNELYSLNLKSKKIKVKFEKDEYKLEAHVLYILPEE